LVLLFLSPIATNVAGAEGPAVVAESEGITVAITNFTPYVLNRVSNNIYQVNPTDANAGPPYPVVVLPNQSTGTSITMKDDARVSQYYVTYRIPGPTNAASQGVTVGLYLDANKTRSLKAAADVVLHATKSKATSSAKSKLKESAKDGAEAAGAADGMTEVLETFKLIKVFAKIFKALDPTFIMELTVNHGPDNPYSTTFQDECITKDEDGGTSSVALVGPLKELPGDGSYYDPGEAPKYFVGAAGGSNAFAPGFVNFSVHSLCDYVCATWNSTLDELNGMSQSDCTAAMISGSTQQEDYNAFATQNSCYGNNILFAGRRDDAPDAGWVTIESGGQNYQRYDPTHGSCSTTTLATYEAQTGVCGSCAPLEASEPLGSWSDSCDEVSYSGGVLTANCATNIDASYTSRSSLGCSTGHWSNNDGELACEEPSGSWSTSCDFVSFSGTTLCASCATDTDINRTSESCQPCTSDVWSAIDGFLSCAPPPATQTASRSATPPAASKVLSPSPHGTPPDSPGVAPNISLASNPNFETQILGADR
jgi:hypothetical protein